MPASHFYNINTQASASSKANTGAGQTVKSYAL